MIISSQFITIHLIIFKLSILFINSFEFFSFCWLYLGREWLSRLREPLAVEVRHATSIVSLASEEVSGSSTASLCVPFSCIFHASFAITFHVLRFLNKYILYIVLCCFILCIKFSTFLLKRFGLALRPRKFSDASALSLPQAPSIRCIRKLKRIDFDRWIPSRFNDFSMIFQWFFNDFKAFLIHF